MEPDAPNCPQREVCMLAAPRPLKRIFGDVHAFECSSCGFMILEYASQRPAFLGEERWGYPPGQPLIGAEMRIYPRGRF